MRLATNTVPTSVPFRSIVSTMILLCCSITSNVVFRTGSHRVVSAFVPTATTSIPKSSSSSSTSSRLHVSFLEELSKSFSTMTNGPSNAGSKYYTVGITGANGLVGTAFQDELLNNKKTMFGKPIRTVTLKRGTACTSLDDNDDSTKTSAVWNPKATQPDDVIDPSVLSKLDALIHLSGENISTGLTGTPLSFLGIRPWTDAKKQEILDSRVITTSALAKAVAKSGNKNLSFLVSSGVGVYGPDFIQGSTSRTLTPPDETADVSKTTGFLAEVSRQWEAATAPATKGIIGGGPRVVNLRTSVVLSTKGGAMAKLYPIFFLGGGGIVGSGKQYFPFISARDMARAMVHVLETPTLKGPVNMIAPVSATNADFTEAMGKVLNRPTILPFPAFAVSLLFGEMGEEVLLGGTMAAPKKLLDSGFVFSHPTIQDAVQSAVNEKNI